MSAEPKPLTKGLAQQRVKELVHNDAVSHELGLSWRVIESGNVEVTCTNAPTMTNGHGIVHGRHTFLIGDTCIAYVCASLGLSTVTKRADITYIAAGGTVWLTVCGVRPDPKGDGRV